MSRSSGPKKRLRRGGNTPELSAQVILRAQSGTRLRPDVPITSRNIEQYLPSREDAEAARAAFRSAGFQVGELVGISFSITAPLSLFERFFGTKLEVDQRGAVAAVPAQAPAGGLELPLSALPRDLGERLVSVTFSPPAELHAGSY